MKNHSAAGRGIDAVDEDMTTAWLCLLIVFMALWH
jgi:hypothetical protein